MSDAVSAAIPAAAVAIAAAAAPARAKLSVAAATQAVFAVTAEALFVLGGTWVFCGGSAVLHSSSKQLTPDPASPADETSKMRPAAVCGVTTAGGVRGSTRRGGQGPRPWRFQRQAIHFLASSKKAALAHPRAREGSRVLRVVVSMRQMSVCSNHMQLLWHNEEA